MSKRTEGSFKRRKNDAYLTWDERAVMPLIPHVRPHSSFCEPCAGAGDLIKNIERFSSLHCNSSYDIDPQDIDITEKDAFDITSADIKNSDYIITNPPWTRQLLHPMIEHFTSLKPVWLLFDADWKYTVQKDMAKRVGCKTVPELMRHCRKVVAVGRLRWVPNSDHDAKDNCAWYLFDKRYTGYPEFIPIIKKSIRLPKAHPAGRD